MSIITTNQSVGGPANTTLSLNGEPPVLGAPLLFELIRSYNILNPANSECILNKGAVSLNLNNEFESYTIPTNTPLKNPTGYYGLFLRDVVPENLVTPPLAGTLNGTFNRHSIMASNPYILLTATDLKQNSAGLEEAFTTIADTSKIKSSIDQYWFRMSSYCPTNIKASKDQYDIQDKYLGYYPNLHLVYAYMMENTKMVQIFERILSLYQHGEDLTIPTVTVNSTTPTITDNGKTRKWIDNTSLLFYSNSPSAVWNDNSLLGSNFEAIRRNAYYRLLGMDLNHGIGEKATQPVAYQRANHTNLGFTELFENFLKQCWQMIINFNNTSNINTTDLVALQELANAIRNMLLSRRSTENNLDNYPVLNLSKAEYASVVMFQWFYHSLSYNSPIVVEMSAEAGTPAERLSRLGQRVGIPCHSKSSFFIDLAPLMATLLRLFELDEIDNNYITAIANPTTRPYSLITSILNNYQLATGKNLKSQVQVNNARLLSTALV
ncbi:MAG TPA: hypothetical protein PLP23_05170 [Panacibacter sp.]|nr:hypothetical protein [Panacibacter sp.]